MARNRVLYLCFAVPGPGDDGMEKPPRIPGGTTRDLGHWRMCAYSCVAGDISRTPAAIAAAATRSIAGCAYASSGSRLIVVAGRRARRGPGGSAVRSAAVAKMG